MPPERWIRYDPDKARALIFGPGGFVDLPMSLENARNLSLALDFPLEIKGQSGPSG